MFFTLEMRKISFISKRWHQWPILILSLSFFYYILSFLYVFHLRHSEDGAGFWIFVLYLSFFYYLLSLFIFNKKSNLISVKKKLADFKNKNVLSGQNMVIKYIGRTHSLKGKPLWEILGNLKNNGIGRMVIRSTQQRYPEASYMKILKVAALPDTSKHFHVHSSSL